MLADDEELEQGQDSEELYEHHHFKVDKGQSLLRIDKFLFHKIENVSRNKIQEAAKAGNIRVNGTSVKPNYKVKPLDEISIVMAYPPHVLEIVPQDLPLNVVYQDEHLAVIDKEPGMVVHPGHGNYSGTLVNACAHHFADSPLFNQDDLRPGLVHRIDKNTSGLLVVAKTDLALNHLARQFFEHTTERKYVALVWGDLAEDEGTITGHIGRSLKDRMRFAVFPEGDLGKHAITHYKVIERLGYVNLVECVLETGRTHQIRVHLEHLGHPLFNDERYGGDRILKGTTFTKYKQFIQNCFGVCPRHALHAKVLGFVHPVTGKKMLFNSELPNDMQKLVEKWRNYIAGRTLEEN